MLRAVDVDQMLVTRSDSSGVDRTLVFEGAADWELRIFEVFAPHRPAEFADGEELHAVTVEGVEMSCFAVVADGALHGFVDLRTADETG